MGLKGEGHRFFGPLPYASEAEAELFGNRIGLTVTDPALRHGENLNLLWWNVLRCVGFAVAHVKTIKPLFDVAIPS
jgi:hypothetical protein